MKKGTMLGSVVVAAAAAAGGYYLMRPKPTPQDVKGPVDTQYEQLCIQLNDLEAKVRQPDANIDSLTQVLEAIKWAPVKDGGKYETEKKNLYLDTKKNVAMTFYNTLKERGETVSNPHIENPETISE